jgi:hypothetical protein
MKTRFGTIACRPDVSWLFLRSVRLQAALVAAPLERSAAQVPEVL